MLQCPHCGQGTGQLPGQGMYHCWFAQGHPVTFPSWLSLQHLQLAVLYLAVFKLVSKKNEAKMPVTSWLFELIMVREA